MSLVWLEQVGTCWNTGCLSSPLFHWKLRSCLSVASNCWPNCHWICWGYGFSALKTWRAWQHRTFSAWPWHVMSQRNCNEKYCCDPWINPLVRSQLNHSLDHNSILAATSTSLTPCFFTWVATKRCQIILLENLMSVLEQQHWKTCATCVEVAMLNTRVDSD